MNRRLSISSSAEASKKKPILRFLTVALSQLRSLSPSEFLLAVGQSLFRNDPILVYMRELDRTEPEKQGGWANVKSEKGRLEELETIASDFAKPPWEFRCHRYDGVTDFFMVKDAGVVQNIAWIYYEGDPNRTLHLQSKEAEAKYGLTMPAFRGKGLAAATLCSMASFLGKRSFRRLFVTVHRDNSSSISTIEKAGFRRVGEMRLRKVLGIQISRPFTLSRGAG
jgi:RimJ/RimL family protein N-acetyltransferase